MMTEELAAGLRAKTDGTEHPREHAVDVLFALQAHFGYLSDEAVAEASKLLGMTALEIDELATFYSFLYRSPVGRHVIHVCDGTACWMAGHQTVLDHLRARLGVEPGETTGDGLFTLLPVCCIGYCDRAPAMLVDLKVYGNLTAERIDRILEALRLGTTVDSTHPEDPDRSDAPAGAPPLILTANRKPDRAATLEEYRLGGGYETLADVLKTRAPRDVQQSVLDAALLGRGGAGFPAGKKWMSVAEDAPRPRYLVCNADEMEPGTFKDRVLLHADPHLILEGMALAAYGAGAERGILFVRREYESAARIFEREIEVARQHGYLGKGILGSRFSFDVAVHRSGGRYICGEVTAQINAIQGKRPNPLCPPPYPTEKGLWGLPTVLHNVETVACVPHLLRNGPDWFKALAATPAGAGTKLYCVSGRVNRPGCFELPLGVSLRELVEVHAGGLPPGRRFKACLPGGASTRFLPSEHYDVALDYAALKALGHRLGTGAVIVFDEQDCLTAATVNLMEFFARESCGWCTPCREGLPYILELMRRIEEGDGREEDIPTLKRMAEHLWKAYCAFAPGAASPLESLLTYFEDEVREHIRQKKCPFGAESRRGSWSAARRDTGAPCPG